ncbi:hypothetical protein CSOJ01_04338 [Colletotrichum sojae]|uniref:Uncharacterized protein n=1 Tax=Colletotrichum sojae TaxID=2175907 RepID=A0A8H6MYQ2_9PEZI|nr:hypothetical protein CSOJ01_04338 [Colletotrichum sojae]
MCDNLEPVPTARKQLSRQGMAWSLNSARRDWLDSTGPDLDLAAPAAYQLENRTLELDLGGDAPHHHQRCSRSGTAVQTVGMGMQRNAAGGPHGPHGRMGVVLSTFRYGCSWLPVDDGGWGPPGASRRHQPGNATLAPAVVTNRSRPRRCEFSVFVTVGCNMVTRIEFRRPLQLSPAKGYIYGRAAQSLLRDRVHAVPPLPGRLKYWQFAPANSETGWGGKVRPEDTDKRHCGQASGEPVQSVATADMSQCVMPGRTDSPDEA